MLEEEIETLRPSMRLLRELIRRVRLGDRCARGALMEFDKPGSSGPDTALHQQWLDQIRREVEEGRENG